MGGRGASAGSGKGKAILSATRVANRAVDAFLDENGGMTSDGEINGVYEEAFIREAKRLGANDLQINNALNANLRTTDIDYIKGNERLATSVTRGAKKEALDNINARIAKLPKDASEARRNKLIQQRKLLENNNVYRTMPKGWSVTEGATTAPKGYTWVDNGKSRFGKERKTALVPTDAVYMDIPF